MVLSIDVIDSHTGGEPTRLVVAGFPDLGGGTMAQRRQVFASEYDHLRSALVCEPRGSDAMVGALLCRDLDDADLGVIFFNNVGYLGMCGHGTIGLIVSLAAVEGLAAGAYHVATPAGVVEATLLTDGRVRVDNVAAHRHLRAVQVEVDGRRVVGDVAYGGNWFFLPRISAQELCRDRLAELLAFATRIRHRLAVEGVTGADGAEIDHVELWADDGDGVHRNLVLCPGDAWDRSPCGTGTSAHLACLAADGELAPGAVLRQRSIIGSEFEAEYRVDPESPWHILPTITGSAWVTARSTLLIDDDDPFRWGIA